MTGEQLEANIYIGPTYYMRLKHMVKDKINYRARGPNTMLTKQPVQGRANDGGLRIGEMERDGVLAHGMSYFLNESFMIRGDEYYIAICNKTGAIAIYNEAKNLFLSPYADGPIQFVNNSDGIKNLSKFGRSFSILRVPYSLKLLMQELQVMNVQMRIITDENVDQLLSMSYSDNINKLLQVDNKDLKDVTKDYLKDINNKVYNYNKKVVIRPPDESPILPDEVVLDTGSQEQNTNFKNSQEVEVLNEATGQFLHAFIHSVNLNSNGGENYDVLYDDGEIEEQVSLFRIKPYIEGLQYDPNSPPQTNSPPQYAPNSPPQYSPNSPLSSQNNSPPQTNSPPQYAPNSPPQYAPNSPISSQNNSPPIQIQINTSSSTPKEETKEEQTEKKSETKTINISESSSDNSSSSNDSTKKITL